MMHKFLYIYVITCLFLFSNGCASRQKPISTYKIIIEIERSADWAGLQSTQPFELPGGRSKSRVELIFTEEIQDIDSLGNSVVSITIDELRYLASISDVVLVDFDSSSNTDPNSSLGSLIGQSYIIEMSSSDQAVYVNDVNDARAAIDVNSPDSEFATHLLLEESIKNRHAIHAIPDLDRNEMHIGDSWSKTENISFSQVGTRSYEKNYILEGIESVENYEIACYQMSAIATLVQSSIPFSSDSTETFTGELRVNLADSKVEQCQEELFIEWTLQIPNTEETDQQDRIKIATKRLYSIERIK